MPAHSSQLKADREKDQNKDWLTQSSQRRRGLNTKNKSKNSLTQRRKDAKG